MNKLGELLKQRRQEKGFSVQAAADIISISRMTLARLEDNKTKLITLDTVIRISNNLEIDFCKMISSFGKKLINLEIKNAINLSKRIYYKGILIDKNELVKLIENNLHNLQANNKEELPDE